jgi:hypothetical protein
LILLVPTVYLSWIAFKRSSGAGTFGPSVPSTSHKPSGIEQAVILGVAVMVILAFIEAGTLPFTSWDADITWDKWSVDWARRSNLYNYHVGGYPQGMPMFNSVLYKLTGTHSQAMPIEQHVLHSLHPLLGLVLLTATVRLAHIMELPSWPVLLVTFGFNDVRAQLTSGGADLTVAVWCMCALTLYVSWLKGNWETDYGMTVVIAPVMFSALFSKALGIVALLSMVGFQLFVGKKGIAAARIRLPGRNSLLLAIGLPVLACLPFYGYQFAAIERSYEHLDPHETNLSATAMLPGLASVAAASHANAEWSKRIGQLWERLLKALDMPEILGGAFGLLALVSILVAISIPLSRPLVFPLFVSLFVWFRWVSYDLRNLLPVLPVTAVILTAGAVKLHQWSENRFIFRQILLVYWAVLAAVAGSTILSEGLKYGGLFKNNSSSFRERLAAIRSGVEAKVALHYPDGLSTYRFLARNPATTRAANLITVGHLYRWFRNGCYPGSFWHPGWLRPGDIFVAPHGIVPPQYDRWILVRDDLFRIWMYTTPEHRVPLTNLDLTGSPPPTVRSWNPALLEVELAGPQCIIAYNLPDRDLRAGSHVLWRAVAEGNVVDPDIKPGYLLYDDGLLDKDHSSSATNTHQTSQNIVVYGGILTFTGNSISKEPHDRILLGIFSSKTKGHLRLTEFSVSLVK